MRSPIVAALSSALAELSAGGSSGKPIRVLGGLHSCARIFESESIIELENMLEDFDLRTAATPETK